MRSLALFFVLFPLVASKVCPDGYIKLNDHNICFKLFQERMNREKAFNACKKDGTSLPRPQNTEENNYFKEMEIADVWLGFTCSSDPSTNQCVLQVECESGTSGPCYSSNGADAPENGTCAYADDQGEWHNANCFTDLATAACVLKIGDPPAYGGGCYNGYFQHDNACYKYVPNATSFAIAESICQSEMAQLTDIGSEEENSFVLHLVNFFGGVNATAWIGLKREPDNTSFAWTNWHPFVYKNFETAPAPTGENECYAQMKSGKWASKPCFFANVENVPGFVCKHAVSP